MTPLLLWFAFGAAAADIDRYPRQAPVTLPPSGVVRIHVPPELRSPADPSDASDLLLVDGAGEVVPIVRLASTLQGEHVPTGIDFRVTPTLDRDVWRIEVRDRPVDGITVDWAGSDAVAARAVVERLDGGSWTSIGSELVWRTATGEHTTVLLDEPTLGTLRLSLQRPDSARRVPRVAGVRFPSRRIAPDEVTVPVEGWRLQENGWARYELFLPQAWPVQRVVLHPEEPLFERQAGLLPSLEHAMPGALPSWEPTPSPSVTVRRVHLDGTRIEQTTLHHMGDPTDRVAVLIDATDRPPLTLPEVTVQMAGVHLLVQDPGPGPHVLYGGGPRGTSPTYDLSAAAPELARMATEVLEAGPAAENPDFVPPEVRARLVDPGVEVSLRRQKWVHEVSGPAGLVRVPIPVDVLARARADLADLRLVDAEDRQIPYVLRERVPDAPADDLAFTRTERGATSILEVTLPKPGVPVSTVSLTTLAPIFDRTITVARSRGGRLEPLRTVRWHGESRPNRLTLDVGQVVDDTLVVKVENGDDPPLPIEAVEVTWPRWELWATLPDGGARLVYGNASLGAPEYDLRLLNDEIGRRIAQVADVGEAASLAPPPLSMRDRLLVLVGLGALALTLLGLVVRLLRAVPVRPEPEPEPSEA